MEPMRLDWSAAEVHDGELKVQLVGELEEGWQERFETTVKLLGEQEWEQVKLEEQSVHVSAIPPGGEGKLRHYLEGVVEQANASLAAEEHSEPEEEEGEPAEGPDAEMQERFRSFADDADAEDGQGEGHGRD